MAILPLSEVKSRLSELADEVHRTHERLEVTRNGREYVVLMAAADLESLEATIELLSDPDAQARIAQSEKELARGERTTMNELREVMEERRRSGR